MNQFKIVVALAVLTLCVVALGFGGKAIGTGTGISAPTVGGSIQMRDRNIPDSELPPGAANKASVSMNRFNTAAAVPIVKKLLARDVQGITGCLSGPIHVGGAVNAPYTSLGAAIAILNFAGADNILGVEFILDLPAYAEDALIIDESLWPAGCRGAVSIHPNAGVASTVTFRTTATEGKGFAFINGTHDVTIDGTAGGGTGLTLKYAAPGAYPFPSADPYAATVYMVGGCDHITVQHCNVEGNVNNAVWASQTDGRPAFFLFIQAADPVGNNNIHMDYNTVTNATFGLKILSEDGNNIEQNAIWWTHNNVGGAYGNPVLLGCLTEFATDIHYDYNTIDGVQVITWYWNNLPTEYDIDWIFAGAPRSFLFNFGQYSGGHIYEWAGASTCHDNVIKNVHATGDPGNALFVYGLTARLSLDGSKLLAYNNRISDIFSDDGAAGGRIYGIRMTSVNFYHNSIQLLGALPAATTSRCMEDAGGSNARNNAFEMGLTGGSATGKTCYNPAATTSDYNAVSSTGRVATGFATFAAYLIANPTKDNNSVNGAINFLADLHLNPAGPSAAEGIGLLAVSAIAGNDIDNPAPVTVRPTPGGSKPDAGADEIDASGTFVALDYAPFNINPPNSAGIPAGLPIVPSVKVKNNSNAAGSFDLRLAINDPVLYNGTGNATVLGTAIAAGATVTVNFPAWTPSAGTWTLTATNLTADANAANDIYSRSQVAQAPLAVICKLWDWNATDDGWTRSVDWVRKSTFTKLTGPYAGASMVTEEPNNVALYTEGANASTQGYAANYPGANILESQWLDLSGLTTDVWVSFLHSINVEPGWDASWVEYTVNGTTWNHLGIINDPRGTNWYDLGTYQNAHAYEGGNPPDTLTSQRYGLLAIPASPVLNGLVAPYNVVGHEGFGWWSSNGDPGSPVTPNAETGPTGPTGYVFCQLDVKAGDLPGRGEPELVGQPLVKFRYVAFSDALAAYDGWAIDNFQICGTGAVFTGNTIQGTVYHDINGNTTNDAEPADVGLKVYLTYFGGVKDSAVTDGTGFFSFNTALDNNGLPGKYDLHVVKPGYSIVGAPSGIVYVDAAGNGATLTRDIGTYQGSITGTKWADDNKDGIKDGGEPGYAGFVIELHKDSCNGALLTTTTTGAGGSYSFGVGPGTYYLKEVQQVGYDQTFPPGNCSGAIVIVGNDPQSATGVNFGNYKHGQIVINKFVDLNGDGNEQGGDVTAMPVGNIAVIHIVGPGIDRLDTLGNNVGTVSHGDLQNGKYDITEVFLTAGWQKTKGAAGYSIVINTSGQVSTATFMNFQMPSACGQKFEDLNGNGVKDVGEPGLAGWKINISGTVYGGSSAITDANGNWCIDSLGGGPHIISEVPQTDWTQTKPGGAGTYSFNGTSANVPGANQVNRDFGNFKNICISGVKYRDRNNNGARDAGEEGMGGVTISVSGTVGSNCVPPGTGTTLTNPDGTWQICCVGPGNHTVTETPVAGYVQTQPVGPGYSFGPATSGVDVSGLDFGNFQSTDGTFMYRTFGQLDWITGMPQKKISPPKPGKPATIPNLTTAMYDYFKQFGNVGIVVGQVGIPKLPKGFQPYLQPKGYGDVMVTFFKKGIVHSKAICKPFDFDNKNKKMSGRYKKIPADLQNNGLAKELLALSINIALSDAGKTPGGYGNLIYDDGQPEPAECQQYGFPLNGKTIRQIFVIANNVMTNWNYVPLSCFQRLCVVVSACNNAFSCGQAVCGGASTFNYVVQSWVTNGKVSIPGLFPVTAVPYLRANPNAEPVVVPTPTPQALPEQYTLYQNYPNPFNPTTSIDFDLPEAANVTLKIYNMLGQEVATLLNNEQYDAGSQTADFDASTLSSGVYIYRLEAQGLDDDGNVIGQVFTQTKKMVLMK